MNEGVSGSPTQFSFPQFDPALGQIQSAIGQFGFPSASGTVSFTYDGIPPECGSFHLLECAGFAIEIPYTVSVSNAGLAPLNFAGTAALDYCCDTGPHTLPWSDATLQAQNWNFDAAHAGPFVGTGQITFSVTTGASPFGESGPGTITGGSVDPVLYQADVVYNYIGAQTPEPSFFFMTAGVLGVLLFRRLRHSKA